MINEFYKAEANHQLIFVQQEYFLAPILMTPGRASGKYCTSLHRLIHRWTCFSWEESLFKSQQVEDECHVSLGLTNTRAYEIEL